MGGGVQTEKTTTDKYVGQGLWIIHDIYDICLPCKIYTHYTDKTRDLQSYVKRKGLHP